MSLLISGDLVPYGEDVELFKNVITELSNSGSIIIFSSHRMEHVEMLCDEIIIMDKGKSILQGNLKQIKQENGNKELNEIFIEKVGAMYEE